MSMLLLYPLSGGAIFLCVSILLPFFTDTPAETSYKVIIQMDLEENWPKWEDRISLELSRHKWVSVDKIRDMADVLGIPIWSLELALAKYASLHPHEAQYGYLRDEADFLVSDWKVLVKVDEDIEDYYYLTNL